MAGQFSLKEFYAATMPNHGNITRLYQTSREDATFQNKGRFTTFSNELFGMLAHMNLTSFTRNDRSEWRSTMLDDDLDHLCKMLARSSIIKPNRDDFVFNPSVTPLVQRYRKLFDEYERQNGLTAFYKWFPNAPFTIITDRCIGCDLCATECPVDAIKKRQIDPATCVRCGACLVVCHVHAIEKISPPAHGKPSPSDKG